jgi:hypothetical protein
MFKRIAGVLGLCLVAQVLSAQTGVERVREEALKPSPLEDNLRRLTDEVGGRVPGTPAMDSAIEWAVQAFRAAGADSVHTEPFQTRLYT